MKLSKLQQEILRVLAEADCALTSKEIWGQMQDHIRPARPVCLSPSISRMHVADMLLKDNDGKIVRWELPERRIRERRNYREGM